MINIIISALFMITQLELKDSFEESFDFQIYIVVNRKVPHRSRSRIFNFFFSLSQMSSSTFIAEAFGNIVFSFTRGVTEHFNPEEPEITAQNFTPLLNNGREWFHQTVDEVIYQQYSYREATTQDYLPSTDIQARLFDASSIENLEGLDNQTEEDEAMAWKRLRPSVALSVCQSMYIGALISLLTATFVGSAFILTSYICYETVNNCQFYPKNLIPIRVQWMRSLSDIIACAFLYIWFLVYLLFLFRPYQLKGVKRKLFLVCCVTYCLDSVYRLGLQVLNVSHSSLSSVQKIPINILFVTNDCVQAYLLTKHFRLTTNKRRLVFFLQLIVPAYFCLFLAIPVASLVYPAYNKQNDEGKLLIALFSPLIGVVLKVISRVFVQRLYNITHPGYSYVLLAPLYCASAVMFRVLQAELDSLKSIVILGIIHGAAEVMERSTMVAIDHLSHTVLKRGPSPWGSFRTPRRESLMADVVIMSMLYESIAIVSVNGVLYLYQMIYLKNETFVNLLKYFAIFTSVPLVIECFFITLSIMIATRYQNMPIMAIWKRRWKRHIVLAIITSVSIANWASTNLLGVVHQRFAEDSTNQPCKMPFT
ncbi:uncharacterized protein LOC111343942 [Stylophora pistillata]|uniref:uncharacterized protein LOC111343942 n=1 Tax=Stylophora pistillata TaxID=50429 RepID=UPI000C04662E|nr:uncharacterized protein LOC111343942 [Stylophora pistillata]XP_022806879.1 uncharacterized protein LOC111343942 [Stylophora pistillata]XP_022806880.1 uncharacterized protein LOC111343942 [Stylophora pistillata]